MAQVFKLLRLQIDNKYDFFKKKKKKSFKSFGGYAFIFALIYLIVYYLARLVITYLQIAINREFITILFASTQAILLIFGMSSVLKNLYMSKDNELLVVFPVTFNQLYLSKILILYISELIFNLVYITPIFLAIGTIGFNQGELAIQYFLGIIVILPIFPILPLAIAAIIGIPSMYIIKFFRKHQFLASIFILAIVVVAFIFYMRIVPTITGAFNIADKQLETGFKVNFAIKQIGKDIPGYYWFATAFLTFSKYGNFGILLTVSAVVFLLCTIIIRPFYKNIILINNESSQIKGRKKDFKTRTQFGELLITQFRLLFRSPNYIFEYLLFPILMPVITIIYDQMLFSIVVNQMGKALIVASHVLVIAIIAFITNAISSTAISRDGGMTYFIKSSPVTYYKQTVVKIIFNALITFTAILMTIIACLFMKIADVNVIILSGLVVFVMSIGHICQSYDWDLRNPILKWYDSNEITTLSKNTTKSIILGLGLALMMFGVLALLYHNLVVGFIIILAIAILYSLARIYLLYYRINYYYNKMEI